MPVLSQFLGDLRSLVQAGHPARWSWVVRAWRPPVAGVEAAIQAAGVWETPAIQPPFVATSF